MIVTRRTHSTIAKMGPPFTRDMFAFAPMPTTPAQLAALRAGFGIGAIELGIARRDSNLVPVLHDELIFSMEVWVAMHPDLRSNRRIRLMFDHLAVELKRYAESSRQSAVGMKCDHIERTLQHPALTIE